jgi:putative transposase
VEADALFKRGWTVSAIARHLDRDRKTVRSYLSGERTPGVRRAACSDALADYRDYIEAEKANYPVIVLCYALGVSTSGYYNWRERRERPARRTIFDEFLTEQIREIHTQSRGTYGSPRVHAELVLGEGIQVGQKRVERFMRQAGIEGIYRRKKHFTTSRDPKAELSDDLVNRQFTVDRSDALWVGDVTEHPTTGRECTSPFLPVPRSPPLAVPASA